ncbi:ABC transporter permease [Labedaea rhizosphaerae]|uniref:Ribose transport system permease protein n=1 Tax=Labedaea rhizosphaerae TaxID=598644 RepID=A0A4R6SGY4_LABRH|nr:ABC transporter permease [Labedaea rhizosphaerae]TDQ01035.1 ribose transport system permease protein [Labedaea rhizosphaerae]
MTMTESFVDTSAATGARPSRGATLAALAQRHGALVVLVILLVAGGIAFDTFLTFYNLGNLAVQASFLAVVTLGMTLVIVSGGIDLSVGSVYALAGVLAAYASQWGLVPALLLPLAVSAVIGLAQGVLIGRFGMAPFIVTLGGLLFARGLLQFITDEGASTYLMPGDSPVRWLGSGKVLGIGVPVLIVVLLFLVGGFVLQRTRYGMRLFALGGNEDSSALMGIPVVRTKVLTYVLSGLGAGLAGILAAAQLGSGVTVVGVGLELNAIAAVVIGGTVLTGGRGGVTGTLAGVALLYVIQDLINQSGSVNANMQQVVSGGVLIVVVVVQTVLSRVRRGQSR